MPASPAEAASPTRKSSYAWSLIFIGAFIVSYSLLWLDGDAAHGTSGLTPPLFNSALLVSVVYVCMNVTFELLPRQESRVPFVLYPVGFWITLTFVPLWLGPLIVVGVQVARALRAGGNRVVLLSNMSAHLPSLIFYMHTLVHAREDYWLGLQLTDIPDLLIASVIGTGILAVSMRLTYPYRDFTQAFTRTQILAALSLYLILAFAWVLWPPLVLDAAVNTEFLTALIALAINAVGVSMAFMNQQRSISEVAKQPEPTGFMRWWRANFSVTWVALGLTQLQNRIAQRQAARFLLLRTLLHKSSDGFATISATGEVTSWNKAMELWTNIPASAAIGQKHTDLLPTEGTGAFKWQRTGSDGKHRYLEGRIVMLPADSGERFEELGLIACRDTTEHVVRDQARNHYVSAITHEFATPLTTIELGVDLVRDRMSDPEAISTLDDVIESAEHLQNLVEDLEVTTRIVTSGVQNISFSISNHKAVDLVNRGSPAALLRNPRMKVDTHNGDTIVHVDLFRGRQIVANLLSNALKYSPPPELVEVSFHRTTDGDKLRILVQDRGPGIPEGQEEAVFERFVRGRNAGHSKGAGLGLASARAIAEAMDCELTYQPRDGGGAVFTLTLPVAESNVA